MVFCHWNLLPPEVPRTLRRDTPGCSRVSPALISFGKWNFGKFGSSGRAAGNSVFVGRKWWLHPRVSVGYNTGLPTERTDGMLQCQSWRDEMGIGEFLFGCCFVAKKGLCVYSTNSFLTVGKDLLLITDHIVVWGAHRLELCCLHLLLFSFCMLLFAKKKLEDRCMTDLK